MSIAIGMLITTFFYLLANLAYFAVLTPLEMLESTAVAVTFAEKSLGGFGVIMPLFVACSVFGAMNGQVQILQENNQYKIWKDSNRQHPPLKPTWGIKSAHVGYLPVKGAIALGKKNRNLIMMMKE